MFYLLTIRESIQIYLLLIIFIFQNQLMNYITGIYINVVIYSHQYVSYQD